MAKGMLCSLATLMLTASLSLAIGCALQSAPVQISTIRQGTALALRVSTITGVAKAPANLISNNSGSLISNNAGSLISNNAAGLRAFGLLAEPAAWEPVPLATVRLLDRAGQPVPGVAPVQTDPLGQFELESVPAEVNWIVEVQGEKGKLSSIITAEGSPGMREITPATTLLAEHMRDALEGADPGLANVPTNRFDEVAAEIAVALLTEAFSLDFSSQDKTLAGFSALTRKHPELGQRASDLIEIVQGTPFELSSGPEILALSTYAGSAGASVAIIGKHFGPTPAENLVSFGGVPAKVTLVNGLGLRVEVPVGAKSGQVTLKIGDKTVSAPKPFTVVARGSVLGTHGVGKAPLASAVDAQGRLWVANSDSDDVSLLSPDGALLGTFAVGAKPSALVIDALGNAWVANAEGGNVTKLSPEGAHLGTFKVGSGPVALATDSEKAIWVANGGSNTVMRLNADGAKLATYAVGANPLRVVVDATDHAWVACHGASSVVRLNPDGKVAGSFAVGDRPYGLALDASGNAWVANMGGHSVSKLTPAGVVSGPYPVGQAPYALAIDAAGNVWVANHDGGSVTKLTAAGASLGSVSVGAGPTSIAVSPSGRVWVSCNGAGTVVELGSDGAVVGTYPAGTGPDGLVLDGAGFAWVNHPGANSVTRLAQ